ncbi:hypothetical protein [Prochlorococcus marinus]|uniref:Uncharacterized protein n=1 Tax=Prochlorococcus marinus str. SB TaxID=59926 RepID=A0A0A2B7P7_PROMR|nr:hypothetical protein [Prochlorococcus marinus]KGG08639.1 hypothetical protein EV02_1312 [Prochlorococcus marinus str. SB]
MAAPCCAKIAPDVSWPVTIWIIPAPASPSCDAALTRNNLSPLATNWGSCVALIGAAK